MEGVTGHASAYRTATTTVLYCCDEHSIRFCGRNTGTVDICTLDDPENTVTQLYRRRGTFTSDTLIDWAYKPRLVVSADSSNCFRVMWIDLAGVWSAELLLEGRVEGESPIRQVLVHQCGLLVLVSSSESDSLRKIVSITVQRKTWKWFHTRNHSLSSLKKVLSRCSIGMT